LTERFAARDYWERRLRGHFDLEGVGYLRLGRRYNEWMYRIRGEVFDRVVAELGILGKMSETVGASGPPRPLRVLDVGAGTGFYVARWLGFGAEVTGVDLTEVAVRGLAERFPESRFLQVDIGQPLAGPLAAETGRFGAVSAFDVLFHIVDDASYAQALTNIAALLEPGGFFLWSDNFIHQPTIRVAHQVSRSLPEISAALDAAGFEIIRRVPMFVVMNYPADTRSRWARLGWTALVAPAMVSDFLGGWLGRGLYRIERRLVRTRTESPSTELMICRKRRRVTP
jgi:2-polyprenyl-3-methyl-5-hydroxy-6-metoxy-1,4-benzoquinol methylase